MSRNRDIGDRPLTARSVIASTLLGVVGPFVVALLLWWVWRMLFRRTPKPGPI